MRRKRWFPWVGLGCLVPGLCGCFGARPPLAPGPVLPDSTLTLRLWEELSPGSRSLFLEAATRTIYGCSNYQIVYRATFVGRTLSIEFNGVSIGPICATALGPARARIPLGSLAEGTYDLRLTARGETVPGQLVVARESYTVKPARGPWTEFPEPVLQRVPDGTIWGLVGYDVAAKEPLVAGYLDALRAAGAAPGSFASGEYGYFRVNRLGAIEVPRDHGYHFARGYLYHFGGDASVLPGVIRPFAEALYISLYTDRGEFFYSWLLRAAGTAARQAD